MHSSFSLFPVLPFRLDFTIWALRRRSINLVDLWDNKCYERLFIIDDQPVKVSVEQKNNKSILISTHSKIDDTIKSKLILLLEKMLNLNRNLDNFYKIASEDSHLAPLATQFMGLKPPRFPSIFEALCNAVSCQQLSLDAGLQIQNRLIQLIGKSISINEKLFYAFPAPKDVANCSIAELKKTGFSARKCDTLLEISSAINADEILFDNLDNKSNDEIVKILCKFKGIGRWSAEYVLLRGLSRIEMFPGDDVGARNNLQQLLNYNKKLDYERISKITKKWYPTAGFIYFHLLLQKLTKKGLL